MTQVWLCYLGFVHTVYGIVRWASLACRDLVPTSLTCIMIFQYFFICPLIYGSKYSLYRWANNTYMIILMGILAMFNPFGICGQVVCQHCAEEVGRLKPAGLFGLTESWTEEPGLEREKQVPLSSFQSKRHHRLLSFSSPWTLKRLMTSWAASFHICFMWHSCSLRNTECCQISHLKSLCQKIYYISVLVQRSIKPLQWLTHAYNILEPLAVGVLTCKQNTSL